MLRYRGYRGEYAFDPSMRVAHGRVLMTRGVVVFQGSSLAELQQDMRRAVDAYLAQCEREGRKPSPPLPDLPDAPESSPPAELVRKLSG